MSFSEESFLETIEDAVDLVLARMAPGVKARLQRAEDELEVHCQLAASFGAGMSVRAMLGLWGKNPRLLGRLPLNAKHPDDASHHILMECWKRLRSSDDQAGG